jgi:hypothetical protein
MTIRDATPYELEADAEKVRLRLGETMAQLRRQLTPSNLVDEWAENNGLKDITPDKILDLTARRHPVRTALAGVGIGFLIYAATRRRKASEIEGVADRSGSNFSVKTMLADLTATAATAFRERAEVKRYEIMEAAKTHVASAAEEFGDTVEKGLDDALARGAVPEQARPILVTTLQLLLAAAMESVLPRLGSKPLRR